MNKILKATVWTALVILLSSLAIIGYLLFRGVDISSGLTKLGYDVCLSLMAASFLTLCLELIGAKISQISSIKEEKGRILRHADIVHCAISNYVYAHLEISFPKISDLQSWLDVHRDKKLVKDGVLMMRDKFSPSDLEGMFSQSINISSGLSAKPVIKYIDREIELRNVFEKIYLTTDFVYFTKVRDTLLEFIKIVDNINSNPAIREASLVRFGKETEEDTIKKCIKDGSFEKYVTDIMLRKQEMKANLMNPYVQLYWKMNSLRDVLRRYEEAIDEVRAYGKP